MNKSFSLSFIALLSLSFAPSSVAQKSAPTLDTIFPEPYSYGVRPNFRGFSYDDKTVYFMWNDSSYSVNSMYEVNITGGDVTKAPKDLDLNFRISPDGKKRAFIKERDLWIADADGSNEKRIAITADREMNPIWSSDSKSIAYEYNNGVWVYYLDGTSREVFSAAKGEDSFNVIAWALNNSAIIATRADRSEFKEVFFPEYNDKFVDPGASKRGIAKNEIYIAYLDSVHQDKLFEGVFWLDNLSVSPSGNTLVADILDPRMKLRQTHRYDLTNKGETSIIFTDSTKGWINPGYTNIKWSETDERFIFTSEKDGYNHLYLMKEDFTVDQLTSGEYEIEWWEWLDDQTIVYASNEGDSGLRSVYTMKVYNKSPKKLTDDLAWRDSFSLSRNKRYLVYLKSTVNVPADLYSLDLKRPRREVKLTNTIPSSFSDLKLLTPKHETITGRDGKTKLSLMMLAEDGDNSDKPVVVFVHGAGSLQNVYKGWSESYPREYLFNQMLAQNGYVVLEVDFRHSLGYGRKFREDVTNWMGKFEIQDIQDGLAHLANTVGADTSRVGIYGGSYGGFLALYAVSHAPESFDAAAALRAVTNWENYFWANQWYTLPRLGHPDKEKDNYIRSSPLFFASQMDKPVILLHGLEDNNVGFQDAVQYIEKLIQSGKDNFDMMMYPTERHSFRDPDAWYDEYRRIHRHFEKWLK